MDEFMKLDQRSHSHLQLSVPQMLFCDVPCMYAVKYWGGMWSNIHEMLKWEVLHNILDSILMGISH